MPNKSDYPELSHFFGAYLNQDYEISGDTVEEVLLCYKSETPVEAHKRMVSEIERFEVENSIHLEEMFLEMYGDDFSPALWGYTTFSFLEELKRLLLI